MSASPVVTAQPSLHHPRRSARTIAGLAVLSAAGVALVGAAGPAAAAQPVGLGKAADFAVLAASTVTSTGATSISGDVGVSPKTAVTGLTPAMVTNGSIHSADATAAKAQADLGTAYSNAAGQQPDVQVTADLGGQRLAAGVYSATTLALTGPLTLDAHGKPDAVFVFQAAKTLTVATASSVLLVNGASACNVFWQVGSSATLNASVSFVGSVLAQDSISVLQASTVQGRLLARTGAVTLKGDRITRPTCAATSPPGSPTSAAPSGSTSTSPSGGGTSGTSGGGTSGAGSTSPVTGSSSSPSVGTSSPAATAPTVGTVSPSNGAVTGGTLITVSGTGFVPGATTVTVGATTVPAGDVHVLSSTRLTFVAPAHAAGDVRIVVRTPFGTSTQLRTLAYGTARGATTAASSTTTLASTGSPDVMLLAGAAVLLLGGVAALSLGRRRHSAPRHRR